MSEPGKGRSRRQVLAGLASASSIVVVAGLAGGCTPAAAEPVAMVVHKDPNCGCCTAWADRMEATGRFVPRVVAESDMAALKARLGVPSILASCHTTEVAGYVIEGHVPAEDVLSLLRERPDGIVGIAVPGMPAGSPGMETPDQRRDRYDVVSFTAAGPYAVFSRHG
nr:DUF411 domain-containing protein [Sphingomonas sp. Y57]